MKLVLPFRWAAGRGLGLAFRKASIYKSVRRIALNCPRVKLPAAEEAWGVINGLSDARQSGLPLGRNWPDIPLCDLSIIVPCYNVAPYVGDCLDSILNQKTSMTFEVVAIDDGSTDATGKILDEYASLDSRVRVVHQANRGFSGARNKGLDLISGGALCS